MEECCLLAAVRGFLGFLFYTIQDYLLGDDTTLKGRARPRLSPTTKSLPQTCLQSNLMEFDPSLCQVEKNWDVGVNRQTAQPSWTLRSLWQKVRGQTDT